MDIGQAFLDDPKHCDFHLAWEPVARERRGAPLPANSRPLEVVAAKRKLTVLDFGEAHLTSCCRRRVNR